ncbi:MAG: hypothetical protein ACLT8E_02680 [Akkermansia sp.]
MLISSIDLSMVVAHGCGVFQNGGNIVANNGYVGGYEGNFNKPVDMTLSIDGRPDRTLTYNGSTAANGSTGAWTGIHTGSHTYDDFLLKAGNP